MSEGSGVVTRSEQRKDEDPVIHHKTKNWYFLSFEHRIRRKDNFIISKLKFNDTVESEKGRGGGK